MLHTIYQESISHTKQKVNQDIIAFLEKFEKLPSFEQYARERGSYLNQIWLNVWLTRVSNQVARIHKKEFLEEKGYDTEGMPRKTIDHLFRTEVRDYHPFQTKEWLEDSYANGELHWEALHKKAREELAKKEQALLNKRKREEIVDTIQSLAKEVFSLQYRSVYVYIRYLISLQLKTDLEKKTRYRQLDTEALEQPLVVEGSFQPKDYTKLQYFLEELTGEIQKNTHFGRSFFEYEVYGDVYGSYIWKNLLKLAPGKITTFLPLEIKEEYEVSTGLPLTKAIVKDLIQDELNDWFDEIVAELEEEYVDHLLTIANIPFDTDEHLKQYEQHFLERTQREALEEEAKRQQEEQEARMMEDIFGREYGVSYDPNVKYVLHFGETNTGKTHHALQRMKEAESGLYLGPLRLLALEVFDRLNADGTPCNLKTGEEEKVIIGARHVASTVEMFHEKDQFDVIIIDEAQMITDKDRGFSWFKAITKARAKEVHIIGSQNAKQIIIQLLGESEIELNEYRREVPLEVEGNEFSIKKVQRGDALICFSRRRVLETASRLQNDGHTVSMIYGSMPPETRKRQIQQFAEGKAKIIVATDAIGMGLNLPIRRIVFLENEKFDGTRRRLLTSQEIKQIAGRAGRKGIYDVGIVAFLKDIRQMRRLLEQTDDPVHTFAIAPTQGVLERFQSYSRDLNVFFELWDKFENPPGTAKASLAEERELYEVIRDTEIEARLSLQELYGYLHMPFASRESALIGQWVDTITAIIHNEEWPEPTLKKRSLEDLELSYKKLGLHLLFLYRSERQTEAVYWERVRSELSDEVHDKLESDVGSFTKKCRSCGRPLSWNYEFPICDNCHASRFRR